jgi:hypothetical protein
MEKEIAALIPRTPRPTIDAPIESLLAARGATHGDYETHARITQKIKAILYEHYTTAHTTAMRESLEMNAHKIGRILAGDPDFKDHWLDISGYATLVANRCSK